MYALYTCTTASKDAILLYLCQFIWYVRYVQQCVILWAEHSCVNILCGATV